MTRYAYDAATLGPYVVDPMEHVGLAHYFARRHRCPHLSYDDRVQESLAVICAAARTYDPNKGTFSTWAGWLIATHLRTAAVVNARTGHYGSPQRHRSVVSALRRAMIRGPLTMEDARAVLLSREGWSESNLKDDDVARAMVLADEHEVRLDVVVDVEGEFVLMGHAIEAESVDPDEALTMADWQRVLASVELTPREREIMERRLLADEPALLQEIGDGWGLSRERVRQIEWRLRRRIRQAAIDAGLMDA